MYFTMKTEQDSKPESFIIQSQQGYITGVGNSKFRDLNTLMYDLRISLVSHQLQ